MEWLLLAVDICVSGGLGKYSEARGHVCQLQVRRFQTEEECNGWLKLNNRHGSWTGAATCFAVAPIKK
jgi:hypothetical protein